MVSHHSNRIVTKTGVTDGGRWEPMETMAKRNEYVYFCRRHRWFTPPTAAVLQECGFPTPFSFFRNLNWHVYYTNFKTRKKLNIIYICVKWGTSDENRICLFIYFILLSYIPSWLQFPLPPPLPVHPTSPLLQIHSSSISFQKRVGFPGISAEPSVTSYSKITHKPSYQGWLITW